MNDPSPEAAARAQAILAPAPRPAPPGSAILLAGLLDMLAVQGDQSPAGVPLKTIVWWLSPGNSGRARSLLGLPRDDDWRPGGDLESACDAAGRAWALEAGGLRPGDHVIALPGWPDRDHDQPRRGTADALSWAAPGMAGQVGDEPADVFFLPDGTARETGQEMLAPFRILLDPDRHPGEDNRARTIAIRSAAGALNLACRICRAERWRAGVARSWLRRRAAHYPEDIAAVILSAAADGAGPDEIWMARLRLPAEPPRR